ncbi:hypothetical protein CBLAS_1038 [Campylobacter blaseri]|uniref:Uncharacterized protein n=1 Tax=Campylobacter blaseri TaxID=2042961 RepID=A0A2P8QYL2_9BACT|nr:hypothetical protein [Campylobacter blaseri]PSM51310.1 hypothetical protein CQ405_08755 [Campylobacter blaseri]PSM52454.1 hypothetical protein CRN67_08760 [Campylobacter blaseri]QKF86216.1 hypothetical protein CBLAS_1038 [Campylobacter blaseri]
MEKVIEWDYTMTGDEFESMLERVKGTYDMYSWELYKRGLEDIHSDKDFKELKQLRKKIFEDKTKTKEYWENAMNEILKKIDAKYEKYLEEEPKR